MNEFKLGQFKTGFKARTTDGRLATFVGICEGCHEAYQLIVHLEDCDLVYSYYLNGKYSLPKPECNLVSMVSPWDSVPIDAKVRVKSFREVPWLHRHYAGLNKEGEPTAWYNGQTSWSSMDTDYCTWNFMELVEGMRNEN